MIPLGIGGITKGIDLLKYDLLGKARNDDQVYIRHMISDHLQSEEDAKTTTIPLDNGFLIINIYKDKCVIVKRKTVDGMITKNTVLPDPDRIEKIKEMYSSSRGIAYAMSPAFDLGYHRRDYNYKEKQDGKDIYRVYNDKCLLVYSLDAYGNTVNWRWRAYNHDR